ncbi:MAG: Gfo/Idh/MocA family oxidoreductase [Gemmatales bacterium]
MASTRLRIALIGCGQIADAHLQELRKIDRAETVAVCDRYLDLARQAAQRFEIDRYYDDVDKMLAEVKPDVVHITTPAQTHAALALQALMTDCHVYVEKPFTLTEKEADLVLALADEKGKKVCLGHDQLFDPIWLEVRELVKQNQLGTVRHIESVLGYPITGAFGSQVASNPNHWVRQLPGGLFQNTISHPLYRITDFLTDERPEVRAHWFSLGKYDFPHELHMHLQGKEATGTLTFLTRIPAQRVTRVYGEKGWLQVDLDAQSIQIYRPARLPGAFAKIDLTWRAARQSSRRSWWNLWRFMKADLHYFAGMRTLFERFYESIQDGTPPPITTQEIRQHAWLMDEMVRVCQKKSLSAES